MSTLFWISYVTLCAVVVLLGFVVVALLRQVGVLYTRIDPLGANPAGEGPEVGEVAPAAGPFPYSAPLTLVFFGSPTCEVCKQLRPSLDAFRREYPDVSFIDVEHSEESAATFLSFRVRSTPFVVTVDNKGIVRGSGIVNSLEQVEELIASSRESV